MSKWISVKERLPEEGQRVLVFADGRYGDEGLFFDARFNPKHYGIGEPFRETGDCGIPGEGFMGNVTHWMPLPPAPNEEE